MLVALLLSGGCTNSGPYKVRNPPYSWGMIDVTSGIIDHVTLEDAAKPGILISGPHGMRPARDPNELVGSTESYGMDPIPDNVIVKWTTDDGAKHQQEVAVATQIADIGTWTGTIWLRFAHDTVQCIPESKKEAYDRAMKVSVEAHRLGLDKDAVPATGYENPPQPP